MNGIIVLLCGLNLNLFPGLWLENKSTQPGVQESLELCTAEEMGEEDNPYPDTVELSFIALVLALSLV